MGLIVFYSTMQFWSGLILKPIMGREFYQHSIGTAITLELSAILVGIAVVLLSGLNFFKNDATGRVINAARTQI